MNKNAGMKCPKTHATGEECAGCPECFSALPEAGSMKPRALLYNETVNEVAVRRDDLWIVTTAYVNAAAAFEAQPVAASDATMQCWAKWIANNRPDFFKDHACKLCTGYDCELTKPGFVCAYHQARSYLAAPSAQPAGAASTAAVRDAALEEAAKLMDPHGEDGTLGAMNATAIRALKSQPADQQAAGSIDSDAGRGVDYIMAAVQSFADEWRDQAGSFGKRVQALNTSARIRRMLEDDARKLAAASLVASVAQPVPDLTNGTVTGGESNGNRVIVDMDAKPSKELWTMNTRCYLASAAPVAQPVPADAEIPPLPEPSAMKGMWWSLGIESDHFSADQIAERDAMWSARVRAALASHSAVPVAQGEPEDWESSLYSAMDEQFELHQTGPRDADGQRQGMVNDDTQIGVEFAMKWFKKFALTAPVAPKEAQQGWRDADHRAIESQLDYTLRPVSESALIQSIDELNDWLAGACDAPITPSQGESILLVLHELRRLRATPTAATSEAKEAQPSQAVPAGWKLVPLDPTVEMMDGAFENISMSEAHTTYGVTQHVWDYMLAAAPVCQAVVPEQAVALTLDELLEAPQLYAQVYTAARVIHGWDNAAALAAADDAIKICGNNPCTTVDELESVLREVLRTDGDAAPTPGAAK